MEQDNNIITASIEAESVSAHTKEKKVSGFKKRFGKKKRKSATQINESNNGVNQIYGTYEAAGEGDVTTDASASVDTKKSFRQRKHLIFIGIIQAMEVITLQSREKAL